MGRALMTPDELRRMDNDLCIIFEKGLKPIKANKYYYFNKPMAKKLSEFKLDHNEFDAGTRGEWRRFNPSNPFSNQINNTNEQDLKVESLDDLFSDDITGGNNTDQVEPLNMLNNKASINSTNNIDFQQNNNSINDIMMNNDDYIDENAPTLPMEDNTKEDELFTKDLQEELEAKFDELFGPIDTKKNNS